MNDPELDDLLHRARVPERSPEYWENFAHETARLAARRERIDEPVRSIGLWRWVLGLGMVTVCLLIGFSAGFRHGRDTAPETAGLAAEQKLFREVAALFPHRLQAIVLEGGEVRLELSESADVPKSPPLLVEICKGGNCRTFITFSGQQVRANGDVFDVLSDANGQVIVAGRNNVWVGSKAVTAAGAVAVRAQWLEGRS